MSPLLTFNVISSPPLVASQRRTPTANRPYGMARQCQCRLRVSFVLLPNRDIAAKRDSLGPTNRKHDRPEPELLGIFSVFAFSAIRYHPILGLISGLAYPQACKLEGCIG